MNTDFSFTHWSHFIWHTIKIKLNTFPPILLHAVKKPTSGQTDLKLFYAGQTQMNLACFCNVRFSAFSTTH